MKIYCWMVVWVVLVFGASGEASCEEGLDFFLSEGSDIRSSDFHRYHLVDSAGDRMDVVKVIQVSDGYYLAVYHAVVDEQFRAKIAESNDLKNWTFRKDLAGERTAMPDIQRLPDNGYIVAYEMGSQIGEIWLHFDYYEGLDSLLNSGPARSFDAPIFLSTTSTKAEGTPDIGFVHFGPDIDNSVIEVSFHYFRGSSPAVDRQAIGRLVDFREWHAEPNTELDRRLEELGCRGNIGGRDRLVLHGEELLLVEGQIRPGDWASWRTFVVGESGSKARRIPFSTHSGSRAFGNPSFTKVVLPSGRIGCVLGGFLFSEGAAVGEAGPLLFFQEIATQDLARGAVVRASSSFDRYHVPNHLIDGDGNTRWTSQARGSVEWVEIDLGLIRPINNVEIRWEIAYASTYSIEVSVDGRHWEEVAIRDGARGGVTTDYFESISARYIKILCEKSGLGLDLYSIWRVTVSQESTELVHSKTQPIIGIAEGRVEGPEIRLNAFLSPGFGYGLEHSKDLQTWENVRTIVSENEVIEFRAPVAELGEFGFFRLR